MQDLDKLIEAAIDLRIANLKARAQGIISVTNAGTEREAFQIFKEEDFIRLAKDSKYTVEKFDSEYKYKYTSVISGLRFFCITNKLLFEENK